MAENRFTPYKQIVYEIIGAAMEVHNTLRWGLLESIYNEALALELQYRGIESKREERLPCFYKCQELKKSFKIDIAVGDIIVELKSVSGLVAAHRAQLLNYLRLTRKPVGLLINFGGSKLQGERYGYIEETNECFLLDRDMNILNSPFDWDTEEEIE